MLDRLKVLTQLETQCSKGELSLALALSEAFARGEELERQKITAAAPALERAKSGGELLDELVGGLFQQTVQALVPKRRRSDDAGLPAELGAALLEPPSLEAIEMARVFFQVPGVMAIADRVMAQAAGALSKDRSLVVVVCQFARELERERVALAIPEEPASFCRSVLEANGVDIR